jgi:hypothetical protein
MRPGSFYDWIGKLIVVRLPDGTEIEGILLEVETPWLRVQEQGVPRHVQFGPGVVVYSVFDRQNPYWEGYERARQRITAERLAKRRRGDEE